jgi:FkbH-like protein
MFRTLQQTDAVKLVVVDLDDTLWRGVAAEGNEIVSHDTEGWPLGFVEALLYLKKRGVLLAVSSKNDDDRVKALWPHIYGGRMEPSDFAVWKVNWQQKPQNMAEILAAVNLLPKNVLFIDDNPVERIRMAEAFPTMRIIGNDPHSFRRVLLWSSETQVPTITDESARRTEMVQSQVKREGARQTMSEAEFLGSLAPRVNVFRIFGLEDLRFLRVLELVNKTNQFNTTAQKWTIKEVAAALNSGTRLYAFEVEDRYTKYGLVGVAFTKGRSVTQFAMSCRVLGLQVEMAALSAILRDIAPQVKATGDLIKTEANGPARDLWTKMGFRADGDRFLLESTEMATYPAHITLEPGIG